MEATLVLCSRYRKCEELKIIMAFSKDVHSTFMSEKKKRSKTKKSNVDAVLMDYSRWKVGLSPVSETWEGK
jgi:hypothetical protein